MFREERDASQFAWGMLGDVDVGRPNLGPDIGVSVYRLMQFTLRDTLIKELDVATADMVFYRAGELAGREFCRRLLDRQQDLKAFISQLKDVLRELKIGVLRVEKADFDRLCFTLTVAEDLDCSGLPTCDETICTYDEGFISGVLSEYAGKRFIVKEIDCWCSGDRVCRFDVKPA